MLSFENARQKVIDVASAENRPRAVEIISLTSAQNRILAVPILADRDYPPFNRAARDGFAVRAADAAEPGRVLKLAGEVKAGDSFTGSLAPGQCIQIMTGAAVPSGADAVVMIEHTKVLPGQVTLERYAMPGQNIVARGREAKAGQTVLSPGARLSYAELAIAAQVGQAELQAYVQPRVAILSTGDEVVSFEEQPGALQIRNSNSVSLAAQIALAGGEAVVLGNARDNMEDLREKIAKGLKADILVLSGGVSMGKYDLVETVLGEFGTEFYFDQVAIRPGKPAVFGKCGSTLVFGLPGNPVSTMVTFELFVVPAIDLLGKTSPRPLPLFNARLAAPVRQKAGLTHFLPARIEWLPGEATVQETSWQGSGDIVALGIANGYLVVRPERLEMAAGELAEVLPRRGVF
ncbi:MAG TPA: gephyrin-like molybdotransferase Glp [Candidatus Dormibacteraeota bacterium]|nr:gephyrin-like molybdotransferase Glp [Candidatus Dormibacteraeota bacterium]